MTTEYLDWPEPGWFALGVMRRKARKWDWVALMVDVDPDSADPDSPNNIWERTRQRWLIIPGKHRNRDAACDAIEGMMTTRH
jgi:hypothetical protein